MSLPHVPVIGSPKHVILMTVTNHFKAILINFSTHLVRNFSKFSAIFFFKFCYKAKEAARRLSTDMQNATCAFKLTLSYAPSWQALQVRVKARHAGFNGGPYMS